MLEAVVEFLIILIPTAPQQPYHKQGTIFLAIRNAKQHLPQAGDDLSTSQRLREVAREQKHNATRCWHTGIHQFHIQVGTGRGVSR